MLVLHITDSYTNNSPQKEGQKRGQSPPKEHIPPPIRVPLLRSASQNIFCGLAQPRFRVDLTAPFKEYCTVALLYAQLKCHALPAYVLCIPPQTSSLINRENSARQTKKIKLSFERSSDELGHLNIGVRSEIRWRRTHFR